MTKLGEPVPVSLSTPVNRVGWSNRGVTVETPAGLLNSIGLQNPGLDRFLTEYLPRLAAYGVPVVVNGGLRTVATILPALDTFDGVMIGREAYH